MSWEKLYLVVIPYLIFIIYFKPYIILKRKIIDYTKPN